MWRKLNKSDTNSCWLMNDDIGQFSIASASECQFYLSSKVATAPLPQPHLQNVGAGAILQSPVSRYGSVRPMRGQHGAMSANERAGWWGSGPGQCSAHLITWLTACSVVLRVSERADVSSVAPSIVKSWPAQVTPDSRVMRTYLDLGTHQEYHQAPQGLKSDCLFGITRMHVSVSCVWFTKLANWPTVNIEGGQAKPRCFTIQISTQRFSEYLDTAAAVIVYVLWWTLKIKFPLGFYFW